MTETFIEFEDDNYQLARMEGGGRKERWYAQVKAVGSSGRHFWCFAGRQGSYRTRNAATKAIERAKRGWAKFIKLSHAKGRRTKRLASLNNRYYLVCLPVHVEQEADPSLLCLQWPAPSGRTRTLQISADDKPTSPTTAKKSTTPASPAERGAKSSSSTTTATRDATPTESAPTAKGPAKARKPRAKQPTEPQSKPGKATKPTTKKPSATGKPRKPSSRKKKDAP